MILGIRPDVIRSALILRYLREDLGKDFVFAWSGQHYSDNLKDVFFRELGVAPPDIDLGVSGSTDAELISAMIGATGRVIDEVDPAATVFLGDTNTVMGSIASAAANRPIVHIEGTMRSYDWRMPEEKYRTVIDHLADVIYSYLPEYRDQGVLEGLDPERIVVTGNPIVDVLQTYFLDGPLRLAPDQKGALLARYGVTAGEYLVMTCHRRENVESTPALTAIMELAGAAGMPVIFPAGYRTQREMSARGVRIPENVLVTDPIGYQELLELMIDAATVLTDSGTIVEETSVLGVPSVQMRTATERPQVYDCGSSVKFDPHAAWTPAERAGIVAAALARRDLAWEHPFGDGRASRRIVDDLVARYRAGDLSRRTPSESRRPVHRNYGFGVGDRGRP
jgi:UDP-N-acetylglucosamine 2-epimerase (non-hydrolysing)